MKRKEYMTPSIELIDMDAQTLLAGSVTSVDPEIGFGGVDENGDLDPSAPLGGDWTWKF